MPTASFVPEVAQASITSAFAEFETGKREGLALIAAYSQKTRAIGRDNRLPWHKPEDLKFFKNTTRGHAVIMGRKSFEALGKPLPGRQNLVLSRNDFQCGFAEVKVCKTLLEAIACSRLQGQPPPFIIGGEQIYAQALQQKLVTHMYITEIVDVHEGDAHFPQWDAHEWHEASRQVSAAGDLIFKKLVRILV